MVQLGEAKKEEWQPEGGSSDKPGVLNLFHHLLPLLPLSLLQQVLESSGRGEGSEKEARDEWRKNARKNGQRKLCTEDLQQHATYELRDEIQSFILCLYCRTRKDPRSCLRNLW